MYSEADLIILDDILSTLDRETSSTIRIRLFSESEIMESGMTTVIMATSMSMLFVRSCFCMVANMNSGQHLVDADVSYELDEDGRIDLFVNRERRREAQRQQNPTHPHQQAQVPVPSTSLSHAQAQPEGNGESSNNDAPQEPPQVKPAPNNAARENVSRSKYGDWSLYKYFLGPAGTAGVLFWLVTYAVTAAVDRLPRESFATQGSQLTQLTL